jgi:uncharacterized membrane protein
MLNWRASLGLIALVAVLLALIMPLPGQEPPVRLAASTQGIAPQKAPADELYHGMINIEGKTVPLPPGEWRLAGRAGAAVVQTGPRHAVISIALVRLRGAAVDAAVLVQTNRLDSDPAWGKATACDRTDLYFARIRYASDHDGSCAYAAYVNAAVRRETTDPAWQAALLQGAGMGWRFPSRWVEAAYRITDPRDAIQVRYLFDPSVGNNAPLPDTAVHAMVAWTEANWAMVGSGFRNRLGAEDVLPDWRTSDNVEGTTTRQQVGGESSEVEHLGVKMITYRIFGTITDMSVNYFWLGSLPSAGGLAVLGAVASSTLYFVHELVWGHFEHPPALVGDLPGVGIEGPGPARA